MLINKIIAHHGQQHLTEELKKTLPPQFHTNNPSNPEKEGTDNANKLSSALTMLDTVGNMKDKLQSGITQLDGSLTKKDDKGTPNITGELTDIEEGKPQI